MWDTTGLPLKLLRTHNSVGVPLDKVEGFVKGRDILSGE
jgi:hypothetical protein